MSTHMLRSTLFVSAFAMSLWGCTAAPVGGGTPCDGDSDCPTGNYCASGGVGCTFDCRIDIDCTGGQTCDATRGRCGVGAVDGGARDGGRRDGAAADASGSDCEVNPDVDGDGDRAEACGGNDCDDGDANRSSLNEEESDDFNRDEDCNPCTVGAPTVADADGDSFFAVAACNVVDERPGDADCPGFDPARPTLRIVSDTLVCGTDCDDRASGVFPGATDSCDGVDNDCDGETDEDEIETYYRDADADGAGDPTMPMTSCVQPLNYVSNMDDCNDGNSAVKGPPVPGREGSGDNYMCDGLDNDCDLEIDESPDDDGDGERRCAGGTVGDCNDGNANIRHGLSEESYGCDRVDNDCSGSPDYSFSCSGPCGGGSATCTGGTASTCSVPARTEACSNTCGSGMRTCSGGAFSECNATGTRVCTVGCATGRQSCSAGAWSAGCTIEFLAPDGFCRPCGRGPLGRDGGGELWEGSATCRTSGDYDACRPDVERQSYRGANPYFGHPIGGDNEGDSFRIGSASGVGCVLDLPGLPSGSYEITYNGHVSSDPWPNGVWVDWGPAGADNYKLPRNWTLTGTIDVNSCDYPDPDACLWYRGDHGGVTMWVDSVSIRRR